MRRMVRFGYFNRGIGQRATPRALLTSVGDQHIKQRLELSPRISGVLGDRFIPPLPAFPLLSPQILRHEFILGGKAAIKAHLVGAGLARDGIDAHGTNALAIEESTRGLHDAVTHAQFGALGNNPFPYRYLRLF